MFNEQIEVADILLNLNKTVSNKFLFNPPNSHIFIKHDLWYKYNILEQIGNKIFKINLTDCIYILVIKDKLDEQQFYVKIHTDINRIYTIGSFNYQE